MITMGNVIEAADAYVKDTGTAKGRGVYAARDFEKGELVEECAVIILTIPYKYLPPRVKNIVYNWGYLTKSKPAHSISLGFGSLYNHDNPANMIYQANKESLTIRYIAVRAIAKDEELSVNYNKGGGSHVSEKDDWFKQRNLEVLEE